MNKLIERKFVFENGNTCKQTWNFSLSKESGELIVKNLIIKEHERVVGCLGHPKTICALLKNRRLNSINIEELSAAFCKKNISCGQVLAECIKNIIEE